MKDPTFRPTDEAARERTRRDFGTSLVLEAGAGTGKTTLLVDRIEALVRGGTARLDQIAAVTFSENAAITMKLRLRERLEEARVDPRAPAVERERASAALDVMERAAISTIHALCAALLQERPLECGVVPGFKVADEGEADMLFAEAWDEWLAERLVGGDDVLPEAFDRGIPLEGEGPFGERTSLRGLARVLLEQRDLVPLCAEGVVDPPAWRRELLERTDRAKQLVAEVQPGDLLATRLKDLVAVAEQSRFLEGRDLVAHLTNLPEVPKHFGHKPRWPSPEALAEGRKIAEWTKTAPPAWKAALGASLHGRLVGALLGVVALFEKKKAEHGLLDFLDLLLKARDALRDRESVRRTFRERYPFLIIDEFQDTDRLQGEIASLLAGDRAGGLVVVGDAKQSIYRFRRAEVALFRALSAQATAGEGRAVLHLTQNFRSRPAILRFVNRAFADLIKESTETDQPPYEAIDSRPDVEDEPAVIALRFATMSYAERDELLQAEARALAAFIAEAARGAYPVRDGDGTRPSRAGDVMVLARRLTQLRHLEEALELQSLRFTVEGGKSFFDRQEVHETLAVLRAIDDPSDRASLVAALRSSFFGVSDRDIVSYSVSGGELRLGEVDEEKPGALALAPAIRLLDRSHKERRHGMVPALLERLYDETRILAALTGTRRGEAQIANLEKVAALAREATLTRQISGLGALTLRGFTTLLAERIASAREEPDLPATRPGDPETVRILSVHRAKGLEAPIVALFDSADNARLSADTVPLFEEGRIAIGFRFGCQPPGWDVLAKREEGKAWAESRRLLYVACTRARDFLVIPKPPMDARIGDFWKDLSGRLPAASDADVRILDADTLRAPDAPAQRTDLWSLAGAEGGDVVAARWEAERAARIEAAAERPFTPISATRLAARNAPPAAVHADLRRVAGEPGGRDFGSLVHRLLEWIPLDEPAPVEAARAMAAAIAPSYDLDADAARRAGDAAAQALALPVMERARRAPRAWRELPLAFPEEGNLVEGTVDLVFEEDGQLVIVDYKTDRIVPEQALLQAAHHAPQLQLYGRGLTQATGLRIKERLVLFTALGMAVPV
jgi:ATP-dependent helicase/nuclease subunit A